MSQTLLKLALPEGVRVYPTRFRDLLAKSNTLPEAFFHYKGGRPAEGLPPVRIVGGKSWLGILADGEGQTEMINISIGTAIQALATEVGQPVKVSIEQFEQKVAEWNTPLSYFVREMVMKRRDEKSRAADTAALVERRLRKGLIRQSGSLGYELSRDFPLAVTDVVRPRGLKLVSTNGLSNEYATLVDVSFQTTLKLTGHWFAGNLTSKGYGRIIPVSLRQGDRHD